LADAPRHRVVNVALPEAPTLREICDSFSDICGFPRAPSVSEFLLRSAATAADVLARMRGRIPSVRATLDKLTQSTVVDTSRVQEMFPDLVWPTFAAALQPAADYYRSIT
jgi:hypothetical protein